MKQPKEEPKVHIEHVHQTAVRLSNRQFGQLRAILASPRATLTIEEVSCMNQLTLGGNKRRGFIAETPTKDGVTLTHQGRQALRAFDNADFLRQVSSMRFSRYLDLAEYDAQPRKIRRETTVRAARATGRLSVVKSRRATA
jgi:hypothetical protein